MQKTSHIHTCCTQIEYLVFYSLSADIHLEQKYGVCTWGELGYFQQKQILILTRIIIEPQVFLHEIVLFVNNLQQ